MTGPSVNLPPHAARYSYTEVHEMAAEATC